MLEYLKSNKKELIRYAIFSLFLFPCLVVYIASDILLHFPLLSNIFAMVGLYHSGRFAQANLLTHESRKRTFQKLLATRATIVGEVDYVDGQPVISDATNTEKQPQS